ncbi:hypothetical protein R8Z50_00135 [Longispora sp. K20-0274]|uniref:hypothetical protein n=1 Tax=Longispora sp. K20-0274 TaxID=3088255 RepID=UPI0039998740
MIPRYLKRPKYAVFLGVFVVLVGAILLTPRKHDTWKPAADCTKASLTTLGDQIAKGAKVYWAATGPEGRYVVTVGAAELAIDADQKVSVTKTDSDVPPITGLTDMAGCLRSGSVDAVLPAGEHTLRLFRIDGETVTEVARKDFKVTG